MASSLAVNLVLLGYKSSCAKKIFDLVKERKVADYEIAVLGTALRLLYRVTRCQPLLSRKWSLPLPKTEAVLSFCIISPYYVLVPCFHCPYFIVAIRNPLES